MKGFSASALILLSDEKKYDESYGGYRQDYAKALDNLLSYLKSVDTEPRCLITDPLAWRLLGKHPDITWYDTEDAGGMYFLRNNAGVGQAEKSIPLSQQTSEALRKHYPIERGLNVERRGFLVSKRVAIAEKDIIQQAKAVFCFGSLFKPRTKPGDGRAIIKINSQFIPSLTLGGYDSPISMFLNFSRGNLALTDWRCNENA